VRSSESFLKTPKTHFLQKFPHPAPPRALNEHFQKKLAELSVPKTFTPETRGFGYFFVFGHVDRLENLQSSREVRKSFSGPQRLIFCQKILHPAPPRAPNEHFPKHLLNFPFPPKSMLSKRVYFVIFGSQLDFSMSY